jgi:hypothetical protein
MTLPVFSLADVVCELDVCSGYGHKRLAYRKVAYGEVASGQLHEIVLPFHLHETEFGVESRILATGRAPLFARFQSDLSEVLPETERDVAQAEPWRPTFTDLIGKELDILQTRYHMLGELLGQLNGK